jgi:Zn-dependent M28 family amino/carboxypeptidase
MKYLFLSLLVTATFTSCAQRLQTAGATTSTNPEKYARTITASDLSRHLYIIASREMEGRETGMPGERKAAAYIENEFRRVGLTPGNKGNYHMFYNVYQDSLTGAALEVNGKAFELNRDFNVNIATNIEATMRFNEVVYLGSSALDTVKAANLAGKLVMLNRTSGAGVFNTLVSKGVAGILYITNEYPRAQPAARKGNQTLNIFRRNVAPQQYFISESVAKAILKEDVSKDVQYKTFPAQVLLSTKKTPVPLETSNVIGIIEGTDLKDEYLVITAHHDHIGMRDTVINYGADDDGSGTVSVIELAEAFSLAKKEGKGPRRTIVFMTVSGEEKGLWGSDVYGSNPIYPLEKTTANLNIDMIGRIDPKRGKADSLNYVYVVGDDKLSSDLRPISEAANKKYTRLGLDYKFNEPNDPMRIYYRSDHYNFAKHGVPIIFYFNGTHEDYHKPTDTPDKINYPLMAKRAQFVFYTAWEMANRNAMLKRDIPLDTSVFNR